MAQAPLRPLREQFTERLIRCVAGLACFGTGIAFFVRSELGVPPWDVFHQGISKHTGLGLGTVLIIVAFFVLLLWIPLRLRPGLGTLLNAVEIGLVENLAQDLIPHSHNMVIRIAFMVAGLCIIAAGSGLYIGAEFGSGPRDGLMLGINKRFGILSFRKKLIGFRVKMFNQTFTSHYILSIIRVFNNFCVFGIGILI
jgi:uncharacterized membrane protein YczE